ncbi:hypothetical protein [Azohydromonas caseinilytica]|uniref:Uncharacterized protein n=1 Tax=Azohydromonas caseinilytica TaxID=2728836 RepID=A0A848FAL0_9BURK|nr:hypothetical protein [Azohydromonas caseinilytica]NML16362.1 hypothetical protein [Azohydromonas caseinilytica]
MYELFQLRATLCRLEEQLSQARELVRACDAVPKNERAPVQQHLDDALSHWRSLVNARGEAAQALAQAHFGKLGLARGAVVTLTYPIYGLRLDAAFDEERLPRRLAQATLKVEGFTVEHVRSKTQVVLGLSGRLLQDGKATQTSAAFCLHPGCEVEILKPAPQREPAEAVGKETAAASDKPKVPMPASTG